mgnify:CR=1 FL=1
MINWKKHRIRIGHANSVKEFLHRFLDLNDRLRRNCYFQSLAGKCNSETPKTCEECMIEWLKADEKGGE